MINTGARKLGLCLTLICTAFFTGTPSMAQEPSTRSRAALVVDSMPRAERISEVALSPDGTRVAYVANGKLTVATVNGGPFEEISVKDHLPVRDIAWSADSKRLAFLADLPASAPSAQVWTTAPDGSALLQHAELKGYAQTLRFSPDGSKLAFLFVEGLPRVAGPLEPMTPLAGVVDEKIYEQRIAALELVNDRLTQLTSADLYVYEYDWSPDGRSWVGTAAHGSGDGNWYIALLYRFDAQSGEAREIYQPKLQIAEPRVSPDGKNIAFIEGLMSDEGSTGGDVFVVSTAGGKARNLTPNIKASPSSLAWTARDRLTFGANIDGKSGLGVVSSAG